MYLPEGDFPARLTTDNPLYHIDPIMECYNRCLDAYGQSVSGGVISNKAFVLRDIDELCACSSGSCDSRPGSGYTSYKMIVDNYHQECWTAGGCTDNGASVCAWCGVHEEEEQYCCEGSQDYGNGHACENSIFSMNGAGHQCVISSKYCFFIMRRWWRTKFVSEINSLRRIERYIFQQKNVVG